MVPRYTVSGGETSLSNYQFLKNMNNENQAANPYLSQGNWVLRGKQKVTGNPSVLSSSFENDFQVNVKGANTGDVILVTVRVWLIDGSSASAPEATYTMTSKTNICFNLLASNKGWRSTDYPNPPIGSAYGSFLKYAYYNTKPHEITPFAQSSEDWVFGAIYAGRFAVLTWPPQGTEYLDPSKPITWKISSQVTTAAGVDTDPSHQPILLGMMAAQS